MAIQIPPNLPLNNILDVHHNEGISPPSAPTVVERIGAIDPRVALKLALPVVDLAAGHASHDAIQDATAKFGAKNLQQLEPHVDKAVLLELSRAVGSNALIGAKDQDADITNLLSQNLSRLDKSGSAALGQLLSNILQLDVPELGEQVAAQNKPRVNSEAIVIWPNTETANAGGQVDPKVALNILYQKQKYELIFYL
jgi:hypothetical protein